MQFSYQLEPTDYEALNVYAHRGTVTGLILRGLPWILFLVLAGVAARIFDPTRPLATTLPVLFAGGAVLIGWKRRHHSLKKRGSTLFAPVTLITSPEGVKTIAPGRSSETLWSQFQGYGETPEHVFLMLDVGVGYIVPKRCLIEVELSSLVSECDQRMRRLASIPEGAKWTAWRVAMLAACVLVVIWLGWYAGHIQPKG